ncbi:parallel beta-helix repeat protein [Anopheles sinensis]|uniref:Parallel beta-helix repeat protein n=1 Tax=Anopheles sinensis TaxID=74873 RepID=A0A084VHD6_ANOSI|nr:parallel beta-helix repeat protein [Anopheles sinensis]
MSHEVTALATPAHFPPPPDGATSSICTAFCRATGGFEWALTSKDCLMCHNLHNNGSVPGNVIDWEEEKENDKIKERRKRRTPRKRTQQAASGGRQPGDW